MKQMNLNPVLQNLINKIFFCSQVFVISLAVPSLYYVGISYNETVPKKQITITNKGKKLLSANEKVVNDNTRRYAAFLQI